MCCDLCNGCKAGLGCWDLDHYVLAANKLVELEGLGHSAVRVKGESRFNLN